MLNKYIKLGKIQIIGKNEWITKISSVKKLKFTKLTLKVSIFAFKSNSAKTRSSKKLVGTFPIGVETYFFRASTLLRRNLRTSQIRRHIRNVFAQSEFAASFSERKNRVACNRLHDCKEFLWRGRSCYPMGFSHVRILTGPSLADCERTYFVFHVSNARGKC